MTLMKGVASLAAAMLIGLSALPAQAGYVVDLTQVGSDVVVSYTSAAPEPTSVLLFGAPAMMLLSSRRWRNRDGVTNDA